MFNVSALLLDDALKPATLLTNGAISGVGLSDDRESQVRTVFAPPNFFIYLFNNVHSSQ